MKQKLFMTGVVASVAAWVVLLAVAFAGEGYDSILKRWMARGGMTDEEIAVALDLPEEIVFVDSLHAFVPGTIFKIDLKEGSGYIYTLTDTIFGIKIFPKGDGAKAK